MNRAAAQRASPVRMRDLRETSLPALYRTWRAQARLLAYQFDDSYLYAAHSFLARTVIESARASWKKKAHDVERMPESAQRKYTLCVDRMSQLANATLGWPHAVSRALDQAYARRGRIRQALLSVGRFFLTQLVAPPHPSPAVGDEARYPGRLRLPSLSPVLRALLVAPAAQRSSPAKESTLACPPKLALARESAARIPGRRIGRRRTANAHWRYVTGQMAKLRLPLGVEVGGVKHNEVIRHMESRAKSPGTSVPRRLQQGPNERTERPPMPVYLASAQRRAAELGVTTPFQRIGRRRRKSGWKSARIDYTTDHRARRRQWARLLAYSPILRIPASMQDHAAAYTHALSQQALVAPRPAPWRAARDALRVAQHAMRDLPQGATPTVRVSKHALYTGKGPRRAARSAATPAELAWLTS